jgi:hypothetical protein
MIFRKINYLGKKLRIVKKYTTKIFYLEIDYLIIYYYFQYATIS